MNKKGCKDYADQMKRAILEKNLKSYFVWLGPQPVPEKILYKGDLLVRSVRRAEPWGRDIIEAMTYGKLVIAHGSTETFIKNGVNGYLIPDFHPEEVAQRILTLIENPELYSKISEQNIQKANEILNGHQMSKRVMKTYELLGKYS
jgi:glycosyltransferase involved in cell wall biosynthesis